LRRGDKLTIWEMSANRDERVFEDPFSFNIARTPNRHLGYGFGAHVCLGAGLARLELKIGFEALLSRIGGFQLAGESSWIPNNRLLGLRDLPLTVKFRP
jgi:cytochrome P450